MIPEVFTALGNLIALLIPDAEIVRGIQNDVPMPLPGFICLTELRQTRLATNETTYNGTNQKTLTNFKKIDVQIDFYGPLSGDWVNVIETVFRDEFAADQMGPAVTPLYCSDAQFGPLTNGEMQYEARWLLTASIEFNPDVVLPQDSMITAVVGLVNVDATYPDQEGT